MLFVISRTNFDHLDLHESSGQGCGGDENPQTFTPTPYSSDPSSESDADGCSSSSLSLSPLKTGLVNAFSSFFAFFAAAAAFLSLSEFTFRFEVVGFLSEVHLFA